MAAFYNDLNILYLRRDIYKIMSAYLIVIRYLQQRMHIKWWSPWNLGYRNCIPCGWCAVDWLWNQSKH